MLLANKIYRLSSLEFVKRLVLTRFLLWDWRNNSGNSLLAIKWVMVSKSTLDGTEDCSGCMSQSLLNLSWLLLAFCSCNHFNSDNKTNHKDTEEPFEKWKLNSLSCSYFSSHLSILTENNIMHGNNSDFVTGVWISVLVLRVWKYLHEKKKKKQNTLARATS